MQQPFFEAISYRLSAVSYRLSAVGYQVTGLGWLQQPAATRIG